MAPLGLDCKGTEAGVTDNFGFVGESAPTALDAARAEFARLPDLAAEAKSGSVVELKTQDATETVAPEASFVLTYDDVVVARVTVVEHKSEWFVSGSANCVVPVPDDGT